MRRRWKALVVVGAVALFIGLFSLISDPLFGENQSNVNKGDTELIRDLQTKIRKYGYHRPAQRVQIKVERN